MGDQADGVFLGTYSGTEKRGVAEAEDAAVAGGEPVGVGGWGGGHGDDGLVEVEVAGGSVEGGVAKGEDAAVAGGEPVAVPRWAHGGAHETLVRYDAGRDGRYR